MRTQSGDAQSGLPLVWLFALILTAAALITATLLYFYASQKTLVRKRVLENLKTMVSYKSILIKRWYLGAVDDAARAGTLPSVQDLALHGIPAGEAERARFRRDLATYATTHGFVASGLVDARGRWIDWSLGGLDSWVPEGPVKLPDGPSRKPVMSDFAVNKSGQAYLTAIVMLPKRTGGPPSPRALVLIVNPMHNVFRALSPSVNDLQISTSIIQKTPAGLERVVVDQAHPVTRISQDGPQLQNSPELQSVDAFITGGEGLDADGSSVFFATSYIPWVHWGLVGTMPQSEGYASLRLATRFTTALVILILLSASLLLYALWNRRHRMVTARLAADLQEQKGLLEVTLKKLYTAVEAERRHLSHELHDELAQLLSTAQMHLYALTQALDQDGGPNTGEDLSLARDRIARATNECRKIIAGLRPPELDRLGLVGAITALGGDTEGPRVDFDLADTPSLRSLPEEMGMVLYRITQEALGNARRHAGAERIRVSLSYDGAFVGLVVADDGRGFDTASPRRVLHFGLDGMRERALLVGGDFHIDSAPGKGTRISVRIPFVEADVVDTGQELDTETESAGLRTAGH